MHNKARRPMMKISPYGISYIHRQNPYMLVWWSAAFPGFGQYLLNQYLRATLLTLTEVIINTLSRINEAIVYTFCGKFDMARAVLQPKWALGYIVIYLYTIWDAYRTALKQNRLYHLAELKNDKMECMLLGSYEIQYLELKKPVTAAYYSLMLPGLGQLYNHRFGLAFYAMFWWWVYAGLSRAYEALTMVIHGNFEGANAVLHPHWLLFMPSVLGGSVYDAYMNCREHNRLFKVEQRQYFIERYPGNECNIFAEKGSYLC